MNKQQETGMAVIVGAILILIVFLTSCTTKKVVTEYVATHDTIITYQTDTLIKDRVMLRVDTLREKVTELVTIHKRDSGRVDTVRVEVVREVYRNVATTDTTSLKEATKDHKKESVTNDTKKEVKKNTGPKWWEILLFGGFIAAVLTLIWRIK